MTRQVMILPCSATLLIIGIFLAINLNGLLKGSHIQSIGDITTVLKSHLKGIYLKQPQEMETLLRSVGKGAEYFQGHKPTYNELLKIGLDCRHADNKDVPYEIIVSQNRSLITALGIKPPLKQCEERTGLRELKLTNLEETLDEAENKINKPEIYDFGMTIFQGSIYHKLLVSPPYLNEKELLRNKWVLLFL